MCCVPKDTISRRGLSAGLAHRGPAALPESLTAVVAEPSGTHRDVQVQWAQSCSVSISWPSDPLWAVLWDVGT